MTFTKADLVDGVRHLAFDIYHFRAYSKLLQNGRALTIQPIALQAVFYALLLHLRLLLGFFYGQPKQDDLTVGHFRQLPGFDSEFPAVLPGPGPEALKAANDNLNKRLAHFTATRWRVPTEPLEFYVPYMDAIEQDVNLFQAALPADVRLEFESSIRKWEIQHPIAN